MDLEGRGGEWREGEGGSHTLFPDKTVIAIVGVVGIARRRAPAIANYSEIEFWQRRASVSVKEWDLTASLGQRKKGWQRSDMMDIPRNS